MVDNADGAPGMGGKSLSTAQKFAASVIFQPNTDYFN